MTSIFLVLLALGTGLSVGALMNAYIARSPSGQAILAPRACAVCAHPVAVADLLPILGNLRLKGKCRRCRAIVPWHYAAAEWAVGIAFALFAARVLFSLGIPSYVAPSEYFLLFLRDVSLSVFLIYIFLFDALASVIPDTLSFPAIGIAFLATAALGVSAPSLLLGGLLLAAFFAVQTLASRGMWVGGGDVRLGFLAGVLFGPWMGMLTLVLAYMLGSVVGIHLLLLRKATLRDHVPFGTFMVIALFVMLFFGESLTSWYFTLIPLNP